MKEEEQPFESSVTLSQVNDKDKRLYHQLQTRIRKVENLKLEKSRILAKQHQLEGLSEGQQRTIERNDQRIDVLMKQIQNLEERFQNKVNQRSKTSGGSKTKKTINEELYGYSSEDDDFYDRTKANQQKIAARKQKLLGTDATGEKARVTKTKVLTTDCIRATVKELEDKLLKLEKELSTKATVKDDANIKQNGDSLDAFMAVTSSQLHMSEIDSLVKRKTEVETELKRQRQLLAVATPALAALPIQTSELIEKVPTAQSSSLAAKPDISTSIHNTKTAPQSSSTALQSSTTALESSSTQENTAVEPKPAPVVVQVSQENRNDSISESTVPKRQRVLGPAMDFARKSKNSQEHSYDTNVMEDDDHVWIPPQDQTGDGRTKLNDKYGY